MIFQSSKLCIVFLITSLVYGCSTYDDVELSPKNSNTKISLIDEAGYKKLVQQRNGKILLVNFWATWCIPCREEFPELVKIANEYQTENVDVVGISTDFPDEIESKVKPYLKSQNVDFQNYVKNFEDDDAFINSVNPEWSGALPATFIYDTESVLRESHFGQNDFAGFRKMIEQMRQSVE